MSDKPLEFGEVVETEHGRAVVIRPAVSDGHIRVFLEKGIRNPFAETFGGPSQLVDLDLPVDEIRRSVVQHYRTGPGKCACGFDAYKLSGIMLDYHDLLLNHLRSNRAKP